MLVQTTKGLIDSAKLEVKDIVTEHENARMIATEWRFKGELVRRDVFGSILRAPDIRSKDGAVSLLKKFFIKLFVK